MPLQNRVTPFGAIEALAGRGTMMGNRGVLHDEQQRIVRPWQLRRWITCVLEFRGRYRRVMQPNRYTELFFLDEATAFAAGHRPCAECRNADYRRFLALWHARFGIAMADDVDRALHDARLDGRRKRTYRERLADLPDGTFVAHDGAAWILWKGALHRWSDTRYVEHRTARRSNITGVLTPKPIVELLRAGYVPLVHASIDTGTKLRR